jgi:hypothetical protein
MYSFGNDPDIETVSNASEFLGDTLDIWDDSALMQGLLEKSKLAQHASKEGHKICWKEAKVLQSEPNTTYTKHKESTCLSLVDHLINQPSLIISPIWTPIITAEVRKLQLRPM